MKILNAIHAQTIGGVDQVFRNYSEVLGLASHEVALLVSDNGNCNYAEKKIFRLKNSSQIFDFFHLLLVLWKYRPDVILCHSRRLMKWMKFAKFFTRAKSVAVNHGISFQASLNCDFIININQEISDLVVASGFDKAKSFVVPNVIKVDETYQEKLLNAAPKIGIYGRIEPRKGFDILLRAAEILQKNGRNFRLKIGGFEVPGGYNLQGLKDLATQLQISEKCDFVGTVFDKKSFFKDVEIFCVPSREEPFGLVILEGFLHSTLVISSNSDGGKFLIKNEKNGLLFANENAADLAKKIEEVLDKKVDCHQLTKSAFSRLEKDFSFDCLSQKFAEILRQISN